MPQVSREFWRWAALMTGGETFRSGRIHWFGHRVTHEAARSGRRDFGTLTFIPQRPRTSRGDRMVTLKNTGMAIAAAALLAGTPLAAPLPAKAHGSGGAVAAGVIGGLAAGALIGAAAAQPYYYGPAYYGPGPYYYGPHCWWQSERVWEGWGWGGRPRPRLAYTS